MFVTLGVLSVAAIEGSRLVVSSGTICAIVSKPAPVSSAEDWLSPDSCAVAVSDILDVDVGLCAEPQRTGR